MDIVEHRDANEFWAAAEPFLRQDPIRHTVVLTVADNLRTGRLAPAQPPILLTVHTDGAVPGAAMCTPPHPMVVSALPPRFAPAVVEHLLGAGHRLPGVTGTRPEVDAISTAWSAATGDRATTTMAERLFRLDRLTPPVGVPGTAGPVTEAELPLLARWTREFEVAVGFGDRTGPEETGLRRLLAGGVARLLWRVDGEPVAFAGGSAIRQRMSRIGPVYTPPEHRGRGYGSAITAATTRWALDNGARHVLLFTDLANSTTNKIYPALGYRPVGDAADIRFDPR